MNARLDVKGAACIAATLTPAERSVLERLAGGAAIVVPVDKPVALARWAVERPGAPQLDADIVRTLLRLAFVECSAYAHVPNTVEWIISRAGRAALAALPARLRLL